MIHQTCCKFSALVSRLVALPLEPQVFSLSCTEFLANVKGSHWAAALALEHRKRGGGDLLSRLETVLGSHEMRWRLPVGRACRAQSRVGGPHNLHRALPHGPVGRLGGRGGLPASSETAMTAEGGRAGLAPPLMMVVLPRFEAASVTTPDHPRRLLFYHDKATTCVACRASAMADESPGCFEVNDEKATVASDPHIRPWKALAFPGRVGT